VRAPKTIVSAFRRFAEAQVSGGLVLIAALLIAIIWANVPGGSYNSVWESDVLVSFAGLSATFSLREVVNEGFMAFFFLLVALEIKREMLVGELTPLRRATLPLFAALGGMIFPALIYLLINSGQNHQGWAIPIATDIALVSGVMSLLGRRLSGSIQVFMLALAIIDDIIAILVIALFYTGSVAPLPLVVLAALAGLLLLLNRLGIRHVWAYGTVGFLFWLTLLQAHIEATLAGVAVALAIPARSRLAPQAFIESTRGLLGEFEKASESGSCVLCNEEMGDIARDLRISAGHVRAPLSLLEDALRLWVAFFVMPVFALANGGIEMNQSLVEGLTNPIVLGVMLGLIFGKQFGIFVFSRASVGLRLARLPAGASWSGIYSVGWLGGIGFTVAIFIANLAFPNDPLLPSIVAGILIASLVSGVGGWLLLRLVFRNRRPAGDGTPSD
jgi:NhaA family Na+:H+ antiporter